MKTYENDAKEILERGKTQLRRKKRARVSALAAAGTCVLVFAVALGVTRLHEPNVKTQELTETITLGQPETVAATAAAPVPAPTGAGETAAEVTGAVPVATTTAIANDPAQITLPWEQRENADKYNALTYGGIQYRVTGVPADASISETALGAGTATGYDPYTDQEHTLDVSVYSVEGIGPNVAVAAKIGNDVIVYGNPYFDTATLGELIDLLDLRRTAAFGKAYWSYYADSAYHYFTSVDFDDAVIWNMLLDDPSVPFSDGESFTSVGEETLSVYFSIPSLAIEGKSLWLTSDGWLCTNVTGTGRFFFIGAEKTKAFTDYVKTRVEAEESVYRTWYTSGDPMPTTTNPYGEETEVFFTEAYTVNPTGE